MSDLKKMSELSVGDVGVIIFLPTKDGIRNKLMNMGVVGGARVECIGKSPFGDPSAFLVRGGVIALRFEDCERILIQQEI